MQTLEDRRLLSLPPIATYQPQAVAAAMLAQITASTTTTLATSTSTSAWGQSITLTAIVKSSSPAAPTGQVVFRSASGTLGTANLSASGVAKLTVNSLSARKHSLTAVYLGNSTHDGSTSAPLIHVVSKAATRVSLRTSEEATYWGRRITFEARVRAETTTSRFPGGMVLFQNERGVLGTATLSNGKATFSMLGLPAGSHLIRAVYVGDANCLAGQSAQLTAAGMTMVDLLAVYTPAARDQVGSVDDIQWSIEQAVIDTNRAFSNSRINVAIRLVATGLVDYEESGYFDTDLERLYYTSDGYMDAAHTWRDRYGADLVTLFASDGDVGGLGYALEDLDDPSNPEYGFSVIREPQASSPTFTLAHELGHNFGASHDYANAGSHGYAPYSHGYRFWGNDGKQYHDIMAYDPGQTIPYFSNPDIIYKGKPIGTATRSNAARVINETAPTVARYRAIRVPTGEPVATRTTLVSSAGSARSGATVTFTATVKSLKGSALTSGTVLFLDKITAIGSATISAGKAVFSTSGLGAGTHAIRAVYLGSNKTAASGSDPLTQNIVKPATTSPQQRSTQSVARIGYEAAVGVWGRLPIAAKSKSTTSDSGLAAKANTLLAGDASGGRDLWARFSAMAG